MQPRSRGARSWTSYRPLLAPLACRAWMRHALPHLQAIYRIACVWQWFEIAWGPLLLCLPLVAHACRSGSMKVLCSHVRTNQVPRMTWWLQARAQFDGFTTGILSTVGSSLRQDTVALVTEITQWMDIHSRQALPSGQPIGQLKP